ncbi:beta-glucosidase [Salmonella enterica subsp. arizonae]|nr:beta-glucosidase [Salmonella enterica subsp. arizonae]
MTVDEKIGQLRLISVGPDNPKEAIREMIKDGQVGAIFNTVHSSGYPADAGSGDGV